MLKYEWKKLKRAYRTKKQNLRVKSQVAISNYVSGALGHISIGTYFIEEQLARVNKNLVLLSNRPTINPVVRSMVRITDHSEPGEPKDIVLIDLNTIKMAKYNQHKGDILLIFNDGTTDFYKDATAHRLYTMLTHPTYGRAPYTIDVGYE